MTLPVPSELLDPIPLSGKSSALSLWVRKTPNLFRGVLELDCTCKTAAEAATAVREVVTLEYAPGLVIPFAFGTILHYAHTSPDVKDMENLIDDRARSRATWQWIIVVNGSLKQVYGIHMWANGYLTPVYENLIKHFENTDYQCQTTVKEPSRFWKRLWWMTSASLKMRRVLIAISTLIAVVGLLLRLFLEG